MTYPWVVEAGIYASQLTAWAAILGRDRLRVYTSEDLKDDPEPAVMDTWRAMGLDPVPQGDTQPTSVYSAVEPTA